MDKRSNLDEFWERDGMHIRVQVLHIALMIESKARWAVDFLLTENKEIGSLITWDFNKRIQFLTTLKALTTDEKGRFTLFQNIRNKLMHEIEAKSLEECFRLMEKEPKDAILNWYPQDVSLPMEQQIYYAVQKLIDEIGTLLVKVENHVLKSVEDAKAAHFTKGWEVTMLAIGDVASEFAFELKGRLAHGEAMTKDDVSMIPLITMKRANAEAQKRVNEIAKECYRIDVEKAMQDFNEERI